MNPIRLAPDADSLSSHALACISVCAEDVLAERTDNVCIGAVTERYRFLLQERETDSISSSVEMGRTGRGLVFASSQDRSL